MRIEKFSIENSIDYCSPLGLLKKKLRESYFHYDSRLTPTGHKLVAQAILDCLIKKTTFSL